MLLMDSKMPAGRGWCELRKFRGRNNVAHAAQQPFRRPNGTRDTGAVRMIHSPSVWKRGGLDVQTPFVQLKAGRTSDGCVTTLCIDPGAAHIEGEATSAAARRDRQQRKKGGRAY